MREYINKHVGKVVEKIEARSDGRYYEDADLHTSQFVGRVPMNGETFGDVLDDLEFNRLSDGIEQSWIRSHDDYQLHVVFYDGERIDAGDSGYSYVYAHWEIKADVSPLIHLRNDSKNGGEGVRRVKKELDEYGVRHEAIRP